MNVTKAVTKDHIFIARFAAKLLQTRMVERSNSVRGRFLNILRETVAIHCASIPEIKFVRDTLHSTSPFDANEGNFRANVKTVISCIGRAPASVISEIASTIHQLLTQAAYGDLWESTLTALKNKEESQQLAQLVAQVCAEQTAATAVTDFCNEWDQKFGTPERTGQRKALDGMVDQAIAEAVSEFREKHLV